MSKERTTNIRVGEICAGDAVRLKGGGSNMTVVSVLAGTATCAWQVNGGYPISHTYPFQALYIVSRNNE